ncbi:MAG: hypothetical protein U0271_28260 [Polyangiaceae bacterium]
MGSATATYGIGLLADDVEVERHLKRVAVAAEARAVGAPFPRWRFALHDDPAAVHGRLTELVAGVRVDLGIVGATVINVLAVADRVVRAGPPWRELELPKLTASFV